MDKALFTAMSGAKQTMWAQAAHSHNLANSSTSGFKADFVNLISHPIKAEGVHASRNAVVRQELSANFSPGALQHTGRDLDVAVDGDGFLAAINEFGEEYYTRGGQLERDVFGIIRNEHGDAIVGDGGPITVPEAESIEVAKDGTISIRALGQGPEALVEVGRLKLVSANLEDLYKGEDGTIRSRIGQLQVDPSLTVNKGYIEGSNVSAVEELTSIVSLARQFELQVKMMQNVSDMAQSTNRLLQVQA